jgi:protein-tyrosine-phosphatase
MPDQPSVQLRAARHAALGDPVRLAIVDELASSDRSPVELRAQFHLESNLLAHHLDVLEDVGLINRTRSSGDGRRRYVHLLRPALDDLAVGTRSHTGPALFVCTLNSARSQLAAALWSELTGGPATSAGTHPADAVHPAAVAAGTRAGIDLSASTPTLLDDTELPRLVVTVCDRAHEELPDHPGWLHWSVPDPVTAGTDDAFDATVAELTDRIAAVNRTGSAA